jgi:hypothetical protein
MSSQRTETTSFLDRFPFVSGVAMGLGWIALLALIIPLGAHLFRIYNTWLDRVFA